MSFAAATAAASSSFAGWVATQIYGHGLARLQRWLLKRKVLKAIELSIAELLRRMPELDRAEAVVELAPTLENELRKLVTASEEADASAIGDVLIHGVPFTTQPRIVVGELLLDILLRELMKLPELYLLLNTRMTHDILRRVRQLHDQGSSEDADIPPPLSQPDQLRLESLALERAPQLLDWPQTLPSGGWLERPELEQILGKIKSVDHSSTVLLGLPGAGKSALLARLGRALQQEPDTTVFGIKADQLETHVDDEISLAASQGLEGIFSDLLLRLSQSTRVILLLDQLDALADLADLTSRRLSVLLEVSAKLAGAPNLHIVASARTFEFHHDPRFADIAPGHEVTLALPEWQSASTVLRKEGIQTDNWPADRKEAMRVPQTLATFLLLASDLGDPTKVSMNYHGMLDQVWQTRLPKPSTRALIGEIAQRMLQEEAFYTPTMRWTESSNELADAIQAGILIRSPDGLRISFRHQTLFDHAVALAFVSGGMSVSRYVSGHQDSLFLRPRLWSILTYLRDADPVTYRRELGSIWTLPQLRLHIQYLIVDFLGSQSAPWAEECQIALPCFHDQKLVVKAAQAVAGQRGWFALYSQDHLPDVMRGDERRQNMAALLLRRAIPFARGEVLELCKTYWWQDQHSWAVYSVLREISDWTEEAIKLASALTQSSNLHDFAICHLATQIAVTHPEEAVRIGVKRLLWRSQQPDQDLKTLADSHGWHDLPTLGVAAPNLFLKLSIEWFSTQLQNLSWKNPSYPARLARSKLFVSLADEGNARENDIVAAFLAVLQEVARQSPDQFAELAAPLLAANVDVGHRMYARAIDTLATERPDLAVQFLASDQRHLHLGPPSAPHLETRRIIAAISRSQKQVFIEQTFKLIDDWMPPRPNWYDDKPAEEKRDWLMRHLRSKLQLFRALAPEQLTAEQRSKIASEGRRFPDLAAEPHDDLDYMLSASTSQMSASDMQKASDDDIVAFLTEHILAPTEKDRRADRDRHIYANVFAKFAEEAPERAKAISQRLPDGMEPLPIYALRGIAGGCTSASFLDWVKDQIKRGQTSSEFLKSAASAIQGLIKKPDGLPDDAIQLFSNALRDDTGEPTAARVERNRDDNAPMAKSVLWSEGRHSFYVPHGNHELLAAIWRGTLLREPCAIDEGIKIVLSHAQQHEERIETWSHFAGFDSQHLVHGDPKLAVELIDTLFNRFPLLLHEQEAVMMVAHTWQWADESIYLKWARAFSEGGWELGKQAFAELITLRHLLEPSSALFQKEIEILFDGEYSKGMLGIAFCAARLWREARARTDATALLVRLCSIEDEDISKAIVGAFHRSGRLSGDRATRSLLEAMAEHSVLKRAAPDHNLLEGLVDIVSSCPENAYRIAVEIIESVGTDLGDTRTRWPGDVASLIHVSVALQRQGEPWRAKGLELFERMLEVEADGIHSVLDELDGKVRPAIAPLPRRLRRVRRSRKRSSDN